MIGQSFTGYTFPSSVGHLSSRYTLHIPIVQKGTIPTLHENIFKMLVEALVEHQPRKIATAYTMSLMLEHCRPQ